MPAFKDHTGIKFGRLTVIKFAFRKDRRAFWKCRCSCGNVIVRTNVVTAKSCGCLRISSVTAANKLRYTPDSAFRAALATYQGNARRRGLAWNLTPDQFRSLTSSPCFYTGRPPATIRREHPHEGGVYTYNGLDRRDNSKGYTVKNSVPCCSEINYFKSVVPHDKFIELCLEVAAHINKKALAAATAN